MQFRRGQERDFTHLETFVWQAIFPAFDVDGLSDDQRAENDGLVENARTEVVEALEREDRAVFVAIDPQRRALSGYCIVEQRPGADAAELRRLIVRRGDWGKGVGSGLLDRVFEFVGPGRPLQLAVRHYNERAIRFFERHGFENTGESAGDFAIPRILLFRAGVQETGSAQEAPPSEDAPLDEASPPPPLFEFAFEPLPDLGLTTEELPPVTPINEEESSLDRDQITDLEAFIARARARKAGQEPEPAPDPEPDPTQTCPNCGTENPLSAKFCLNCGHNLRKPEPIPEPVIETVTEPEPEPEIVTEPEPTPEPESIPPPSPAAPPPLEFLHLTPADLKQRFREHLYERLHAYFGERGSRRFWSRFEQDDEFLALRNSSLTALSNSLNGKPDNPENNRRIEDALADLVEYFIVERCKDIHKELFAQRLLRHQSIDWNTADLFQVVMDYLDLDNEAEKVYTDFIRMSPKVLRRVTDSFLKAGRDERVFVIVDQSLLGNGKNGFAVTDSGLYWKSMLQPAGAVTYTTVSEVRRNGDHLILDGQFFDAGPRLNLKVALLVDKLARMH